MHGFMIAADRSGAGKTTVTRALMLALKERGFSVCPFKCGPDYIDPMYHSAITGVPGHNLDTFFTDEDTTRKIFARDLEDAPETNRIAVAEGVMGLFDGVTGFLPEGSSYDMARVLHMPVILCINARGAAQTLLAVISGILNNDIQKLIKGIFLNQVSDGFAPVLSQKIEEAFAIPVVGHFPVTDEIKEMKSVCDGYEAKLKVILETGCLVTEENIRKASRIAMEAGADFIKTSTGKEKIGATPEAALWMCEEINEYFKRENRKVGFKAAGGINTSMDAVIYYTIVKEVLGKDWLCHDLFRIGTSRLADILIEELKD